MEKSHTHTNTNIKQTPSTSTAIWVIESSSNCQWNETERNNHKTPAWISSIYAGMRDLCYAWTLHIETHFDSNAYCVYWADLDWNDTYFAMLCGPEDDNRTMWPAQTYYTTCARIESEAHSPNEPLASLKTEDINIKIKSRWSEDALWFRWNEFIKIKQVVALRSSYDNRHYMWSKCCLGGKTILPVQPILRHHTRIRRTTLMKMVYVCVCVYDVQIN